MFDCAIEWGVGSDPSAPSVGMCKRVGTGTGSVGEWEYPECSSVGLGTGNERRCNDVRSGVWELGTGTGSTGEWEYPECADEWEVGVGVTRVLECGTWDWE